MTTTVGYLLLFTAVGIGFILVNLTLGKLLRPAKMDKEKAAPPLKGFKVTGFAIDYTKCMFCALCVDPCPVDCIFMGSTFDQSCFSRDGCVVDFAKLPLETAWGQASLNPTAIAASKMQTLPVWEKKPDPPKPAEPAPATAS